MSFERENRREPKRIRRVDPRFLLGGYALGLVAMSPAPLVYYWLLAPVGALLAAGTCVLVSLARPRFADAACGALLAAVFGLVTVLVMFFFVGARG
ncbi:hypothetical protein [Mycolicibacterium fluoranthenivorans]|uniref:Uncharacterized protein n=1 Tax=Mycolicibacterium fluoranthenivorans TaxID=258505 RepID=A0A7X5ZCQ8_9MYCO|nr:hypothetical protein [Mycolicibacterium fluoranthenivorans]MCV7357299.1 hypothetical protein [Mycolicibacterium fluoranthenivorans]NIH95322.1 hypothetical protein [Mycolicibacterium fluoranthenivorans]